jgi:hypothetical protein
MSETTLLLCQKSGITSDTARLPPQRIGFNRQISRIVCHTIRLVSQNSSLVWQQSRLVFDVIRLF